MSTATLFDDPASIARKGALLSPCGQYRYRLWRRWGDGSKVLWVMLNPSTADHAVDDPTLRKCAAFARGWGFQGLDVVNLYAYRTALPRALAAARRGGIDVLGPSNDLHLAEAFSAYSSGSIVCAWGDHAVPGDAARVRAMMPETATVVCLGRNASGSPRHPLYLAGNTPREPWGAP